MFLVTSLDLFTGRLKDAMRCKPLRSVLTRGGMVEHFFTKTEDTKIKSIRVSKVLHTRVGSDTIWVKLKEDTIDCNSKYKEDAGTILKSPGQTYHTK